VIVEIIIAQGNAIDPLPQQTQLTVCDLAGILWVGNDLMKGLARGYNFKNLVDALHKAEAYCVSIREDHSQWNYQTMVANLISYMKGLERRADIPVPLLESHMPEDKTVPLSSIDELLLVEGFTEDILYDQREPDVEALIPGLSSMITVWTSLETLGSLVQWTGFAPYGQVLPGLFQVRKPFGETCVSGWRSG